MLIYLIVLMWVAFSLGTASRMPTQDYLQAGQGYDQFLQWMSQFPCSVAYFLPSGISDHSPMILSVFYGRANGPKAYRYYNTWAEDEDFIAVIEEA